MFSISIKDNKGYNFIKGEIYEFNRDDDILYVMYQGLSRIDFDSVFWVIDFDLEFYKFSHKSGVSFKNYQVVRHIENISQEENEIFLSKIDNIRSIFDCKVREFIINNLLN